SGSFSASGQCTLSGSGHTSNCSVNYTPSSAGTGSQTITATYPGDSNYNAPPNATTALQIYGTATKYIVTSTSNTPAPGTAVTITAQLADANGTSVPTLGKVVTWSNTGSGRVYYTPDR